MRVIFWIAIFLICVLAAIFGFQNREVVTVSFIGWSFRDVSVGLLVFASVSIGIMVAALVAFVESASLRWERRKLKQRIVQLEGELALKAAPQVPPAPAPRG